MPLRLRASRLRGGAAALLCFAAASALCAAAAAQRTLADALGALDLDAAASAATCAAAASGDALSKPCATTLGDLSAAASALDYAAATVSDYTYDYTAGDAASFMTGALARAAASLPAFCEVPSRGGGGAAGNLSCAQELDVTVGSYLTRLGAARGTRPGCSAEAGTAAAGGAAAALSLLTRAACLRAEPSRGGGYCLASLPAALQASGAWPLRWHDASRLGSCRAHLPPRPGRRAGRGRRGRQRRCCCSGAGPGCGVPRAERGRVLRHVAAAGGAGGAFAHLLAPARRAHPRAHHLAGACSRGRLAQLRALLAFGSGAGLTPLPIRRALLPRSCCARCRRRRCRRRAPASWRRCTRRRARRSARRWERWRLGSTTASAARCRRAPVPPPPATCTAPSMTSPCRLTQPTPQPQCRHHRSSRRHVARGPMSAAQ